MQTQFLFADEAGCFTFERSVGASRYFILCTILVEASDLGIHLMELRRRLYYEGRPFRTFKCSPADQEIRDEVFAVLQKDPFSVHATIMDKSKAPPNLRASKADFYLHGWSSHLRRSSSQYLRPDSNLVTGNTISIEQMRNVFDDAFRDICRQVIPAEQYNTTIHPCDTHPYMQAADYCTWAIQRKWEDGDERSYAYIADQISYENQLWQEESQHCP